MQKNLKKQGYKLTKPRQAILKFIQKTKNPLSAQAIHQKLKADVDLVSVYRNLSLFEDLGLIFSEEIKGEKFYYKDSKPHHHIVCAGCGKIECVPCEHKFRIKNFSQVKHNLSLTGLCLKCNK